MEEDIKVAYKKLQEKNYPLVFIAPGEKFPMGRAWQKNPVNGRPLPNGAGLGLLLGEPSGVVCLDMDTLDEEIKDKIRKIIPKELIVSARIGNPDKLAALFFRMTKRTESKILWGNISCELLSTGQQVVIAGIHKDKKIPYQLRATPLTDISADELPEIPDSLLDAFDELNREYSTAGDTREGGIDLIPMAGRCKSKTHIKLSNLCLALLHGGHNLAETTYKLLQWDSEVNPEISYFECPSRPEWRKSPCNGYIREARAVWFVLDAYNRNQKKGSNEGFNPFGTSINFEKIELAKDNGKRNYETLPKLEGLAGDIFKFIYDVSPIPRSQFAHGAALSTLGTLLSGKISFRGKDSRLYTFFIAPSTFGKDAPSKLPIKILKSAGFSQYAGPANIVSEAGVLLEMVEHNVRLFRIDEAHKVFQNSKNKGTGIRDLLAELYTAEESYDGKRLATSGNKGKERVGVISYPRANMLLTSTPGAFSDTFDTEFFKTGLGGRFIYFFEDRWKDLKLKDDYNNDVPLPLIEKIKELMSIFEAPHDFIPDQELGKPEILKETTEGKKYLDNLIREIFKQRKEYVGDPIFEAVLGRKIEMLQSLIIINHCSKHGANSIKTPVDITTIKFSHKQINAIIHNALVHIDILVSDNKESKLYKKMIAYMKKRNDIGTSSRDFHKRFNGNSDSFTRKEREEALKSGEVCGDLIMKDKLYFVVKE